MTCVVKPVAKRRWGARQLFGHADSGVTQRVYSVKPDTIKPLRGFRYVHWSALLRQS
jgi:hypothetical protein